MSSITQAKKNFFSVPTPEVKPAELNFIRDVSPSAKWQFPKGF